MPKGVEHITVQGGTTTTTSVPLPVMPKGVEHYGPDSDLAIAMGCPSQ